MRTLKIAEYVTLDGVVEAPERWHFPYVDEDVNRAQWAVTADCDTMLLGRVTYETFAGAFATAPADDPVASVLNGFRKVVVSSTLRDPAWANTTVLQGELVPAVRSLKEQAGGNIVVNGSTSVARALLAAGLVDELYLQIHPIVVGAGERLFPVDGPRLAMEVASSEVHATGVISVTYRPTA
jgi:dihydrofolate reductase